jgi:hypothetical protein
MGYIAVGPPGPDGVITAMLVESTISQRTVRTVRDWSDIEELKTEWSVDEVRGEGLRHLPAA